MKKSIIILIAVLAFISCNSTSARQSDPARERFTVDLNSAQIPIGEIEAQFLRSFVGLRRDTINVIYFPQEDAVCLQYQGELSTTYRQFWSWEGRSAFIRALEQYKQDFDARTISSNNSRTRAVYGSTEGFLTWQSFSFSVRASSNIDLEMGYQFRDRMPYFTVSQREGNFIDVNAESRNRTSPVINMYFTRAQADELAAFFDPVFLRELTMPESVPRNINEVDVDRY